MGQPEQDIQNNTGRTGQVPGQAEQDRQNRTGRKGQAQLHRQNRPSKTGQAGRTVRQGYLDRITRIGMDRMIRTGQPG
jgi:hypothetical protein